MIERRRVTHAAIDTDVASWLLDPRPSPHADAARRIIGARARVVSFIAVTELRYGALRARWGELRLRRLERSLAQKIHEADRWVAATALALGLELVAGDGIFEGTASLDVHRIYQPPTPTPPIG